ncbi:hypothetical protein BL252_06620 [Salmonella enterica]|nr:hypothetical protein [Salmonella enterica]EBR4546851.1 hypothetical protein [Salmonella enterica]EBZ0012588.1 hypothetical protein [Salmonella enterica subsp. enterica serovar Suberu]
MKKLLLAFFLLQPLTSWAVVIGGSNLGFSGYPEFNEISPSPPLTDDRYAWDSYQTEVNNYVAKAKQYVNDADSDIQRVQESQQDVINKANSVVNEYNRAVNGY